MIAFKNDGEINLVEHVDKVRQTEELRRNLLIETHDMRAKQQGVRIGMARRLRNARVEKISERDRVCKCHTCGEQIVYDSDFGKDKTLYCVPCFEKLMPDSQFFAGSDKELDEEGAYARLATRAASRERTRIISRPGMRDDVLFDQYKKRAIPK